MMNKKIMRVILSVMMLFCMPVSVWAQENNWINDAEVLDSNMQYIINNNNVSRVKGVTRGRVISSVGLQLSDEGDGVIGVYAETLCHTAVKEIYMVIYLDVWDDEIQDWVTLNDYEYTWKASDYPDRDLTDVSVSFLLEGLPRGKTYSLRGRHGAKNFTNTIELMASETDGITLG